eukprot:CAMPEP_0194765024 /NCGR_PEP_ID=MMETSP0323_2-20130528/24502_1 /TAXON_ID=2866 ORGANISM="Crypthecodinium cohnii, Strain Seligo" /NCGR_SAMPLE_ID=MMETSP0323_2 /ASSEMBLY_ACC=CAM_ASM_000346 /LENGTH=33 /DNA_ID= /DNA_START= /DNA_END= /DNA_ORIENTATION=
MAAIVIGHAERAAWRRGAILCDMEFEFECKPPP